MTPTLPDPEQVNTLVDNLASIVTGATVLLLGVLRILGRKKESEVAKAVLTERPVSHAELLQCQMQVKDLIQDEFRQLRSEFIQEIKDVHERIDKEVRDYE